jgi:hypothetical protein
VRRPPVDCRDRGQGTCSLCAGPILNAGGEINRRRSWHAECVALWFIATSSAAARAAVERRDAGRCAGCGSTPESRPASPCRSMRIDSPGLLGAYRRWFFGHDDAPAGTSLGDAATLIEWRDAWYADHIEPLWRVDRAQPGAFRFWTIANLQTLCTGCHAEKTRREAGERARARARRLRAGAAAEP